MHTNLVLNLSPSHSPPFNGRKDLPCQSNGDKQIARLRTLQEVSRKLTSKLDLEDALTSILDEAIRTTGAERGCLLLADAATGTLEARVFRHLQRSDLTSQPFHPSHTVIQRVWLTGRPVLTANAGEDPALAKAASVINYALRSILCVPLDWQGNRIGVLYLDNRVKVTQFEEDDLALALAIADQAAIVLRNAQLHQEVVNRAAEIARLQTELEERLAEMQSILAITRAMVSELGLDNLLEFIMVHAEYLTNAEGAAVLLLSDDGLWLEVATPVHSPSGMKAGARLLAEEALPGLAIASQKIQVSNDIGHSEQAAPICSLLRPVVLRSLMCASLIAQGKNLGVLMVWNKRGQIFTQNDNRLISLFADQAALALQNAHLHAQNRQLAIEEERHRLARDLHDSVTQSLYGIALAAQTSLKLLDQPSVDGEIRGALEHIQVASRTALTDMRDQLSDLHPTALTTGGLMEALAQHCAVLGEQYALAIEFVADQEPPVSTCQREALYYIAREALWNTVKYAGAKRAHVWLTMESKQVALTIMDDGAGFDPTIFARTETTGLRNMEERAKLVGGTFELETQLGRGTRVTVRIPA
jgi:signal transduction histidine kinase